MKTIPEIQTPSDAAPNCLEAIAGSPARRTDTGVRGEPHQTWHRILVPVDFTPASAHALHRASSLAERFGSTVLLLYVVETHPFATNATGILMMKEEEEDVTRDTTEQLSRLGREEMARHVPTRLLVRHAKKAAQEIVRTAAELGCDLIILTSHKRTALGRVLFGSTANEVMHQATGAVLVIPCTDEPEFEPTLWRADDKTAGRQLHVPPA